MHVYKFRMLTHTNDDFVRDFEILGNQTFLDFHKIIQENVNLGGDELASFHICDQKWTKLKEITLLDMQPDVDEEEREYFEEHFPMKSSKIKDFITEPHQHLLYEYDFLNMKTFFLELIGVWKQKTERSYPVCTKSEGKITDNVLSQEANGITDADTLKEQLLEDFNDLLNDSADFPDEFENEF